MNTLEFEGKVIKVCAPISGTSKKTGNQWKAQQFVIESDGDYPKKCVFQVFGEERINEFGIKEGERIKAYLDIDANEYNGKWFNNVGAWKVEHVGQAQAMAQSASPVSKQNNSQDTPTNDLPF